jgi:hypothetical protein
MPEVHDSPANASLDKLLQESLPRLIICFYQLQLDNRAFFEATDHKQFPRD